MGHGASLDERLSLRVPDKKRLDQGAQVSWVVAGELLDLSVHADPLALNNLACTLREVLPLGEISLCKSEPAQLPSRRITLNLSSAALRQLGAVPRGAVVSAHSARGGAHHAGALRVEDRGQPTGALSTLFRYQIGRLSIYYGRKMLLN